MSPQAVLRVRAAAAPVYAGDDELGGAGLIRVRHQPCVGPTHISLQLSMIQQDLLLIDDGRRILRAVRPHEGESGAVLVGGATGPGAQSLGSALPSLRTLGALVVLGRCDTLVTLPRFCQPLLFLHDLPIALVASRFPALPVASVFIARCVAFLPLLRILRVVAEPLGPQHLPTVDVRVFPMGTTLEKLSVVPFLSKVTGVLAMMCPRILDLSPWTPEHDIAGADVVG